MSRLLSLPVELQLQIGAYLIGDAKNTHHVHHLLDLALTCRQLASIAQEALCLAPILQSSKVDCFLHFLSKHPELAKKIKNLTIETKETRKGDANPATIAHLEPNLLDYCKRHVRKLPVRKCISDNMIALLKRGRFEEHSTLTAFLLTMLPQLEHLYLGGSILLNFSLFHGMPADEIDTDRGNPDWAGGPDLTWVLPLIGPKLTALELSVDLRRSVEGHTEVPISIRKLSKYLPNLRWLSVPHMAAIKITGTGCEAVIPPKLETLVLTDARCNCFDRFSRGLLDEDQETSLFPRLSKVELYHRYETTPTDKEIVGALKCAGIEVVEYIPMCCLRSGDEYYHPWKYTPDEIGALEDRRHVEYAMESEREGDGG